MSDSLWNRYNKAAKNHKVIVPSDTVNMSTPCILVAKTAGTVTFLSYNDQVVEWTVVVGQTIPVVAKRVNATGTTATLVGIY